MFGDWSWRGDYSKNLCFFIKDLPELDFKYFSKLKAVYLFSKLKYATNLIGNRSAVAGT